MKTVKEVSDLSGISVRTLHYYDKINLLKPTSYSDTGYRYYDDHALQKLQQILFFKEFDLPLKEIKRIMENPSFDKDETLRKQKQLLLMKKNRLNSLVRLIDEILKGENAMSFKEFSQSEIEKMFDELMDGIKEEQLQELIKPFGSIEQYKEAYMEHAGNEKTQQNFKKMIEWYGNGKDETSEILYSYQQRINEILKRLIEYKNLDPATFEVRRIVGEYEFICRQLYQVKDIKGLMLKQAEMFLHDQSTISSMDQSYESGSSNFIGAAIQAYYHNV